MRGCDNSKIHTSSNFILSICLPIMFITLQHLATLNHTTTNYTTSSYNTKYAETIKTHNLYSIIFFWKSCRLWDNVGKNIVQPDRPQTTIWRMRIACRIPKATNTHSRYLIIIAFLLQQRLLERASMLRCTFIACLVSTYVRTYVRKYADSNTILYVSFVLFC